MSAVRDTARIVWFVLKNFPALLADWLERLALDLASKDIHPHQWADISTYADAHHRREICTLPGCGEERLVPRTEEES